MIAMLVILLGVSQSFVDSELNFMSETVLKNILHKEDEVMACLRNWDEDGALKHSDESRDMFETNLDLCQSYIELYAFHLLNRFAIFWNVSKFEKCEEIIDQLDKMPLTGQALVSKLANAAELEYAHANYPKALWLIENAMQYACSLNQKFELLFLKGQVEHEINGIPFEVNSFSDALGMAEAIGNQVLIAKVYSELYTMFYSRYPGLAVYFARKAEVIYSRSDDIHRLISTRLYISLTLKSIYNRTKEECFKQEADKIVKSIDEKLLITPSEIAFYNRVKGTVLTDIKPIERALDYYTNISRNLIEKTRTLQMMLDVIIYTQDYESLVKYMPLYRKLFAPQLRNELDNIEYCLSHNIPAKPFQELDIRKPEEPFTLLDVLDHIALCEERWFEDPSPLRAMFPNYFQEGMFNAVAMPNKKTSLVPCGLLFNNFYRGESEFHEECKPSLYRPWMTPAKQFVERLKYAELCLLMESYPIVQYYHKGVDVKYPDGSVNNYELFVDKLALAQHYGIYTELMDFTVDKFVAAFFACTKCDSNDIYSINDEDGGDGCFYRYVDRSVSPSRLRSVGLQPFSRPGEQAGYVLQMEPEQNLNDLVVEAIHFKHNRKVSEFIYNYTNRSNKLFPKNILDGKAMIIKRSQVFSQKAYELAKDEFYPDFSDETLMGYLKEEQKSLCAEPIVSFTSKDIEDFHKEWKDTGEKSFLSKILFWPVRKG